MALAVSSQHVIQLKRKGQSHRSVPEIIAHREITFILRLIFLLGRQVKECLSDVILSLNLVLGESCPYDTEKSSFVHLSGIRLCQRELRAALTALRNCSASLSFSPGASKFVMSMSWISAQGRSTWVLLGRCHFRNGTGSCVVAEGIFSNSSLDTKAYYYY